MFGACSVRFPGECVAKLFAALRARNNRILVDGATNQRCALSSDVESMFRQQPLKIVLQHIPGQSGHRETEAKCPLMTQSGHPGGFAEQSQQRQILTG
jgi:hypothetical protein